MTWKEHLAWCKERALAELDRGDLGAAVSSMIQDVQLYRDEDRQRARDVGILVMLGTAEAMSGDPRRVRLWIEGWN